MHFDQAVPSEENSVGLEFLWLELTNRCNLRCVHCYAESGPYEGGSDVLQTDDYIGLLDEAREIGCRNVQFIGGEPTLYPELARLIVHADEVGYELIEVFTNLTQLKPSLVSLFKKHGVEVATSVYADVAGIHDVITTVQGSFARTIDNLKKLVDAGIPVRAGVISMEQNAEAVDGAIAMLKSMGVTDVGRDRLRKIGRGAASAKKAMSELCGQCAGAKLSVGPDGLVSPCIMSKAWSVGSVRHASLSTIVRSRALHQIRHEIATATNAIDHVSGCNPDRINPCPPDRTGGPACNPNTHCGPNDCQPQRGGRSIKTKMAYADLAR